jgi:hypothetical protein
MLEGGIKPVIKNAKVVPGKPGLGNELKALVADQTLEILSDDVPGRDAVATTIPIRGKLTSPEMQLWPTVFGVVRNAFVEGIGDGFANLPPPSAKEREGVIEQGVDALRKDAGPPKAQPPKS